MKKYKDMTYSIRADGRLMKKMTVNHKVIYVYSYTPEDLYRQYLEKKFDDLNRFRF